MRGGHEACAAAGEACAAAGDAWAAAGDACPPPRAVYLKLLCTRAVAVLRQLGALLLELSPLVLELLLCPLEKGLGLLALV